MHTRFHIIYKTRSSSGKYYVGRHSTDNLDDGYLGSGRWVASIKDKSSLEREVLSYHNTFDELVQAEKELLDEVISDPNNMNYSNEPIGFGTGEHNPSFQTPRIPWNRGLKCPQISNGRKAGKQPHVPKEVRQRNTKAAWERGVYNDRPPPSTQHKAAISQKLKGRPQSEYQKQRASETHKGRKRSSETRKRISEAATKREAVVKTCPHCGKVGNGPVMRRWHFSNCKFA